MKRIALYLWLVLFLDRGLDEMKSVRGVSQVFFLLIAIGFLVLGSRIGWFGEF